jgi:hypothetical protein
MNLLTQVSRVVLSSVFFVSFSMLFPMEARAETSIENMQFAGTFIYNPRTLKWKAINDRGKVVRTGRGSGGRNYCPDVGRSCRTPTGTYHIISRRGAACKSSIYPKGRGGAPMPYCMFFTRFYGVHGSPDVPNYNASHGCVRVPTQDAKWLYNNFMSVGTKVIIKSY